MITVAPYNISEQARVNLRHPWQNSQQISSLQKLIAPEKHDSISEISSESLKSKFLAKWVRLSIWRQPCEAMFEYLSKTAPHLLCDLILTYREMDHVDIANAAYALHDAPATDKTVLTLVSLLKHEKPYVREGAVHGLANKTSSPIAFHELSKALTADPIEDIKEEIREIFRS